LGLVTGVDADCLLKSVEQLFGCGAERGRGGWRCVGHGHSRTSGGMEPRSSGSLPASIRRSAQSLTKPYYGPFGGVVQESPNWKSLSLRTLLEDVLRLLRAEVHVLSRCPEVFRQQAANQSEVSIGRPITSGLLARVGDIDTDEEAAGR